MDDFRGKGGRRPYGRGAADRGRSGLGGSRLGEDVRGGPDRGGADPGTEAAVSAPPGPAGPEPARPGPDGPGPDGPGRESPGPDRRGPDRRGADRPERADPTRAGPVPSDAPTLAGLEARADGLGRPMTRLRRLTLGLLLEAGGPVKAYDLVERARALGRRLTPASVYRVLDFLLEAGLIHKVNSLNAYVVCSGPRGTDHHPLIVVCPDCRKATEIDDGDLARALLARLDDLGHGVEGATVEIRGLCRLCAAK